MNVGPAEILVILVIALIVFGPKRLPEIGRQVGSAVRELRRMQDQVRAELDTVIHPDVAPDEVAAAGASPPADEPDHTALPAPTDVPADDDFRGPATFS
jgi:Tat protein translocase TatB subunit